jgi:hypothetical protein
MPTFRYVDDNPDFPFLLDEIKTIITIELGPKKIQNWYEILQKVFSAGYRAINSVYGARVG